MSAPPRGSVMLRACEIAMVRGLGLELRATALPGLGFPFQGQPARSLLASEMPCEAAGFTQTIGWEGPREAVEFPVAQSVVL